MNKRNAKPYYENNSFESFVGILVFSRQFLHSIKAAFQNINHIYI